MSHIVFNGVTLILGGLILCASALGQTDDPKLKYLTDLTKWREAQETDLKADEGFLSVAGLFWLKEGDNTIGTSADSAVRLPAASGLGEIGALTRHENSVTLTIKNGIDVTVKGQPVTTTELKLDSDRVTVGNLKFTVIHRGQRIGVRLFDKGCKGYKEFTGLKWYEPNLKYKVNAKFVPYDPPKSVNITNVLGDVAPVAVVGYVEFTLDGKTCRLDAQGAGSGLFINFRDSTSGDTTYPAGRFLDTGKVVDGHVLVDFNRATNPPCAFTAFATCPLPPHQNTLPIPIPAGEKTHHPAAE